MFSPGEKYTHEDIYNGLSVGNAGGIRICINTDRSVRRAVLFTSVPAARIAAENPYHDRLEGDILVYTAAGQEGDQTLAGPNKRILEQLEQQFPIYGFLGTANRRNKIVGAKRWMFLGLLQYLRHYKETQLDSRGAIRSVWIFEFYVHSKFTKSDPEIDSLLMAELIVDYSKNVPLAGNDRELSILSASETTSKNQDIDAVQLEVTRRDMLSLHPQEFENLVRRVLECSGFADVFVTRYSQDGGIDVSALASDEMWALKGMMLQVQAKRWLHTVGRKEVAELRGSLQANARGAVITTSHFSRAAVDEATESGKMPIVLVDGFDFARVVCLGKIAVKQ